MSYSWMLVRGGSANPSSLKYTALMNKQSIAENELFKPEKQQPDIISTHTEDLVAIQDPFMFTKLKPKTIHYRGGYEPDGVRLKLWAKFDHIARLMRDRAMTVNLSVYPVLPGNVLRPNGNPKLCEGPDFDGIKGGSIVTKLNSDPNIVDYYNITNTEDTNTGISAASSLGHVGFSMFFRFMLEGEPVQHNGKDPTLWFHYDMGGNNFYHTIVRIGTDKSLKFFVRDNEVDFNFISAANAVISGVWTTACLTYRFTGNVLTMSINNVPQTDSANETIPAPLEEQESGIFIGAEAGGAILGVPVAPSGRFVGRLDDVRWYTDLVFNRDHETNIWNNGRSICAVPVVNFGATDQYINCGNQAEFTNFTKLSYFLRFKAQTSPLGTTKYLLGHGNYYDLYFVDFDDNLYADFFVDADLTTATGGIGLQDNKWHNALCVIDTTIGSNNIKLYVDGVLVGQETGQQGKTYTASGNLNLGNPSQSMKGDIRDFRLWKGVALTEAQVIAVRDNLSTAPMPSYWLKMNEGNDNPVDWITRTKVGTLTNGATWTMGSSPRPTEYGSLSVAGYARFNDTVDTGGYDSTGFDSTGFDTT